LNQGLLLAQKTQADIATADDEQARGAKAGHHKS
jgi:predicted nucleic acid-binding protein